MRLTRASISRWRAAAALLGPVVGCGPTVSLDEPELAGSSGTSTGAGPFGVLSSSGDATLGALDEGPRLDLSGVKLDVAPDLPLPPGSCPPDCQFTLDLVWAYDGPAGSGAPLDPEDHVAVIEDASGGFVVVEERQGRIGLARLSDLGQETLTMPLALPCDPCRLVDVGLHPSGDLLIAGHGRDGAGAPVALAARVELGGPQLVWATTTALATGGGIAPRAGSLVVHDDGLLYQPALEAAATDMEQLVLLTYDAALGGLVSTAPIATGLGTGDAPPPRAAYDADGSLVVTHPTWASEGGLGGTLRWLAPADPEPLATAARVEPSLRLAAGPDGRVLTLGQTPGASESLLYLDSGPQRDPDQWQLVYVLPTVTSSTPALAVDGYGHAHVLARTAVGRLGHEDAIALEVLRWSDEGTLVWKLALPLALDRVDEPVSLALALDGDLVIGGFVGGARHVEKRDHGCDCL